MSSKSENEQQTPTWLETVKQQHPTQQQEQDMQARLMQTIAEQEVLHSHKATTHDSESKTGIFAWLSSISFSPKAKMSLGASFAFAFVFAIGLITTGGVVSPAFASVQEKLAQISTMYYTGKMSSEGQTIMQMEVHYQAPNLVRIVTSPVVNGQTQSEVINILDTQAGKGMTLMPMANMAMPMNFPANQTGNNVEDDPLSWLNKIMAYQGEVIELPPQYVNGIYAYGYQIEDNLMQITLWVDSETTLPVNIQTVIYNQEGASSFVFDADVEFNQTLDNGLFDMVPPKSYQIMGSED
jgi:outer membrane lipoprotein-sorting protein